jgi:hypothetical protein
LRVSPTISAVAVSLLSILTSPLLCYGSATAASGNKDSNTHRKDRMLS